MAVRAPSPESRPAGGPWAFRAIVLGALAATLWFVGPRAWRVAAAHLRTESSLGVVIPLDRIEGFEGPGWLEGALLRGVLEDLAPRLRADVRLMDDDGARAARERIAESPFVLEVRLERSFPDRFRVGLELRRPELQVIAGGRVLAWLDGAGVALPPGTVAAGLPQIDCDGYGPPVLLDSIRFGAAFPDDRIRAAAAVAREWRESIVAEVGADTPALVAIDARNVGWQWIADLGTSQILVGLRRADHGVAWFHHGRAEDDGGAVPAATRAEVLRRVLLHRRGLTGVLAGDLRLLNRWEHSLRLEPLTDSGSGGGSR